MSMKDAGGYGVWTFHARRRVGEEIPYNTEHKAFRLPLIFK